MATWITKAQGMAHFTWKQRPPGKHETSADLKYNLLGPELI